MCTIRAKKYSNGARLQCNADIRLCGSNSKLYLVPADTTSVWLVWRTTTWRYVLQRIRLHKKEELAVEVRPLRAFVSIIFCMVFPDRSILYRLEEVEFLVFIKGKNLLVHIYVACTIQRRVCNFKKGNSERKGWKRVYSCMRRDCKTKSFYAHI